MKRFLFRLAMATVAIALVKVLDWSENHDTPIIKKYKNNKIENMFSMDQIFN